MDDVEEDYEDDDEVEVLTSVPPKTDKVVTPSPIQTRSRTKPQAGPSTSTRSSKSKGSTKTAAKSTAKRGSKATTSQVPKAAVKTTPKSVPYVDVPSRVRVEDPIESEEVHPRVTPSVQDTPSPSKAKSKGKGKADPVKSEDPPVSTSLASFRASIPSLSASSVQQLESQLRDIPSVSRFRSFFLYF